MWIKKILLAILGLSFGMGVAAGLFSFLIGLGVISDFADRTHTGKYVMFYEDCLAIGGIVGNLFWIFRPEIYWGKWLVPVFGLFSGMFVGAWSMALAEALNIFPILLRRTKMKGKEKYLILALAFGKGLGSFIYFIKHW